MPFTLSHPAAVLPLIGVRWEGVALPASALVIGSLMPDLPYFMPLPVTSADTHSLRGAFTVDLMLGLCVYLVWHLLLVAPLVWAAPGGLQRRIPVAHRGGLGARPTSLWDLGLVLAALLLGTLTHLMWDAPTHADMWAVQTIAWLSYPVLGLPVHRYLHLLGSVLGIAALVWYLMRWWRSTPAQHPAFPVSGRLRWGAVAVLLTWAGVAALRVAMPWIRALAAAPGSAVKVRVADGQAHVIAVTVEFLSTLALGLLCAAALWHVVVGRNPRQRMEHGGADSGASSRRTQRVL